ncbi:DUF2786 domain-containing protein [Stappia sp. TSB10P1A]|uniref:DUF2786 domain-containing protein n=1 Tax=Stappia sp. TSB10P1A TaxID=2003585 RepID=UPI0016438FED|nr:DUF2786 domain-containing protein [Stappia sp. TSB10P1A]
MDKKILNKIRKCLALARSGNENEAAAALAKARELMDAHGVTDEQLELADIDEATARACRVQRPPVWDVILANTVGQALGVTCYLDARGDRAFVGRGASAEIASYAYAVLFRRLKAERAAYIKTHLKRCKPARKRLRADVFCESWAGMVYLKIKALIPERRADPLVRQYLETYRPGLVTVEPRKANRSGGRTDSDSLRGALAGSEVNLNAGLQGENTAPLALT